MVCIDSPLHFPSAEGRAMAPIKDDAINRLPERAVGGGYFINVRSMLRKKRIFLEAEMCRRSLSLNNELKHVFFDWQPCSASLSLEEQTCVDLTLCHLRIIDR